MPDHNAQERPIVIRALLGGALMGLANLVPGISGGTMLLVSGVYGHFVRGIANLTTFRWRLSTLITLGCIIAAALVIVVSLAGPVGQLVVEQRWIMYSLFVGLTFGGVPALWPMVRPVGKLAYLTIPLGIAPLAWMAFSGAGSGGAASSSYLMLFIAGIAGASAMVLPGVSGAYLLLLLGQYVPILTAVHTLKEGLKAGDTALIMDSMHTVIPVGLGVVTGVVVVSNLMKILLDRWERATAGVLLGLLLGAVLGLWPFQEGVAPAIGDTLKGQQVVMTDGVLTLDESGKAIEARDYPVQMFDPSTGQAAGAIGLMVLGIATSMGIGHIGRRGDKPNDS